MKKNIITFFIIILCVTAIFSPIINSQKTLHSIEEEKENEDSYYHHVYANADFTWSPEYPDPDEEVTFISKSHSNGYITSYRWNFGDGNTYYGRRAKHTFENKDTYKVTLRIYAQGWTYIDGQMYPSYTSASRTKYIKIGAAPFPKFSLSNNQPAPGENIILDASESWDPYVDIVSYNWSYYNTEKPDNITLIGDSKIINYSWEEQGIYNIKLSVENEKGNVNELEKTLTVSILRLGEITNTRDEIYINIFNQGKIDAVNLTWDIEIIRYSAFDFLSKQLYENKSSCNILKQGENKNFTINELKGYGRFVINVKADSDNAVEVSKSKFGYIIGEQIYLSEYEIERIKLIRRLVILGITISSILLSILIIINAINKG